MRRAVAAVMIRERSRCFACQLHGRSDRIGHGARRRDIDSRYYYRTSGEIAVLAYVSFIVCPTTVPGCADLGFSRRYAYLTRFFKNPLGPRLRVAFAEPSVVRLVASTRRSWILVAPSPRARSPLPATATHVCTCGACRAHLYNMRTFAIPRTAPDTRHRRGAIRHRGGRSNRNCGGRGSV